MLVVGGQGAACPQVFDDVLSLVEQGGGFNGGARYVVLLRAGWDGL